jgi:hypothetical protein
MLDQTQKLSQTEAQQLWATLGEEGKSPAELTRATYLLPAYSVGIEEWVDRLAKEYLQNLCREYAHFKVVLAPYGGGKTHFLMVLGSRALAENYAVAYIPCKENISLDKPLDIYREFVKKLHLPGEEFPGIQRLLERIVENKRKQIEAAKAPDCDSAFELFLRKVSKHPHPENAFGRVIAEALKNEWDPDRATAGDAALRWLQGDIDTLTKDELISLRLAKVPANARAELGRNLLMSLVQFSKEAGVHGVVLLFDEIETLFTARGKALLRVLSAMRVLVDLPTGIPGGSPLFGAFSAVPDIMEQMPQYPALQQRLAVLGSPFEEGNDHAPQIQLEKIESQTRLLANIGLKLIKVGRVAKGHEFDIELQSKNAEVLAQVAADRNMEVDARRLYVKAWVNILNLQAQEGERDFSVDEFSSRYQGIFDELRNSDRENEAP